MEVMLWIEKKILKIKGAGSSEASQSPEGKKYQLEPQPTNLLLLLSLVHRSELPGRQHMNTTTKVARNS
jgi:hypothetical protein